MPAKVHVTLNKINSRAENSREIVSVPQSQPLAAETLTSSGTAQTGTIVASPQTVGNASTRLWEVTSSGGDVFVAFGTAPTAASGTGFLVVAGSTRYFSVTNAGEKISVKDA